MTTQAAKKRVSKALAKTKKSILPVGAVDLEVIERKITQKQLIKLVTHAVKKQFTEELEDRDKECEKQRIIFQKEAKKRLATNKFILSAIKALETVSSDKWYCAISTWTRDKKKKLIAQCVLKPRARKERYRQDAEFNLPADNLGIPAKIMQAFANAYEAQQEAKDNLDEFIRSGDSIEHDFYVSLLSGSDVGTSILDGAEDLANKIAEQVTQRVKALQQA